MLSPLSDGLSEHGAFEGVVASGRDSNNLSDYQGMATERREALKVSASSREVELCFGRVRSYLAGAPEVRKAWGLEDMFEALDNLDLPEGPERHRRRVLLARLEKLASSP